RLGLLGCLYLSEHCGATGDAEQGQSATADWDERAGERHDVDGTAAHDEGPEYDLQLRKACPTVSRGDDPQRAGTATQCLTQLAHKTPRRWNLRPRYPKVFCKAIQPPARQQDRRDGDQAGHTA